jgi:hypothetical protein
MRQTSSPCKLSQCQSHQSVETWPNHRSRIITAQRRRWDMNQLNTDSHTFGDNPGHQECRIWYACYWLATIEPCVVESVNFAIHYFYPSVFIYLLITPISLISFPPTNQPIQFSTCLPTHPCGGGVEYLRRDPARCKRRRKGSLRSETIKYDRESQKIRTRETLRWQVSAAYVKDRLVLSSERAPHKSKA